MDYTVASCNTAILSKLPTYNTAVTLSTTSISSTSLSTNDISNLSAAVATHLSATATGTGYTQNPNSQNYLSLLVTSEDAQLNNLETNQHPTLTSNISPATITKNKSLDTIFPFKLKELLTMLLFSEAALEEKLITAMYTNAKVDGHFIKLILDSELAGSIITKQLIDQLGHRVNHTASTRIITADEATKTPIDEIDDFFFEVNGIIIFIKALVGNDWLSKINAILDWMTQELQLSHNSQHTHVPATCDHFKTINLTTPLIEFKEEEKKPT
ncbi:hypothetical protein G9A89_011700 [Geosiphon pyriformis]|nr:hypothetical protein G9A89_011700 [Geosiphon pyriformis]